MTTEQRVCRIIDDFLEPAEGWSLTSSFADLGSDSLAMMAVSYTHLTLPTNREV